MNRLLHIKKIFLLIWVISIIGCDPENPTQGDQTRDNVEPDWKLLGFEDKFALKLEVEGDYLYVASGRDGLWKMNLEDNSHAWELLGLSDSEMLLASSNGVLDVDAVGNEV